MPLQFGAAISKLILILMRHLTSIYFLFILFSCSSEQVSLREEENFNGSWHFQQAEIPESEQWREVNLPHDWSIEGDFSAKHPAGTGGGALPGGVGWYRKLLSLSPEDKDKQIFIQFDGIYRNSTLFINKKEVGTRPNGYISFEYDITEYLDFSNQNEILVKVDNAQQPNSRWYSGSGIYRDVRLVKTPQIYFPQYAFNIKSTIDDGIGNVNIEVEVVNNLETAQNVALKTKIFSPEGTVVSGKNQLSEIESGERQIIKEAFSFNEPVLWSIESPNLYTIQSEIYVDGKLVDDFSSEFGIRSIRFDADKGFFLNGQSSKIKGVCLHHDLGALGAAFNERAMERQLEIMQGMGVNAIRTSHNPPAPAMLDLCDRMGLLVMDEMFDMWAAGKSEFDYSLNWDDWHVKDLQDFVKRDRNHPSVIIWSVGNEIIEQYNHEDSTGGEITKELAAIVRSLDNTRPITTGNNDTSPENTLIKNGGLDLVGFNYHHEEYESFPEKFPGKPFIATETNSSLATRGYYDMPSDSVRIWPKQWDIPFEDGNPDNTVSSYDNVRTPWGSLQEETWPIIKKHDFLSGMFIWTGFDYLGEPTPYTWPSRSSYFGIVDLAGFPKDTYYMYKSEWTKDTVLHVFPHWNWEVGQEIDVWAYYNQADEVELFLNDQSLGKKSKNGDALHVQWRVPFEPGTLKAVSLRDGKKVTEKLIKTAGSPSSIQLSADRNVIDANGRDLSFISVTIHDEDGYPIPNADNEIIFSVTGNGKLRAVDNGDPVSHESFIGTKRKAFNGKCLAIIQSTEEIGEIQLTASSDGLKSGTQSIITKKETE